ncbi:MAG: hypothetical protein R3Y19_02690 [Rikenellaceae bacterium]
MKLKIAEHPFTLSFAPEYRSLLGSYFPFESFDSEFDPLFRVEISSSWIDYEIVAPLLVDVGLGNEGEVRVNIYQTREGILYNIIMPGRDVVDVCAHVTSGLSVICFGAQGNPLFRQAAFDNAMILSFISFTLSSATILLHASAVIKDGRAYLFLGKSGTGKSTHSRQWLESFSDAELLNDDHPVVRCFDDGRTLAFGSPWSGKTRCYRNLSADLGALVRIKRAGYNRLTRLSVLRGYASVFSSCSGAQWSPRLLDAKVRGLELLATRVGCYEMECLPENLAAVCCYTTLCELGRK